MAVRIKFDQFHNAISPTLVLATKNGDKLGVIPATNISFKDQLSSSSSIQFIVHKESNGSKCPIWDDIIDFKLVWCPEWDIWFEINVEVNEEDESIKTVTGVTVGEAELSQINLYEISINTESDISRDDYEPTVIYNSFNPNASLLNRILEKAPHYSIGTVDNSIKNLQRTFTFDNVSIYGALQQIAKEIDCLVIIDSGSNNDGTISRKINLYDLDSVCLNCGERGRFSDVCPECGNTNIRDGYGNDTNVFVSIENLANNIIYKTNTGSVKNCFRLIAGDDLMTAIIRSCNPSGSNYIWHINDEMKSDMSEILRNRINSYDAQYKYYKKSYSINLTGNDATTLRNFNSLIDKYSAYNSSLTKVSNPIVGQSALMKAYYDVLELKNCIKNVLSPDSSPSPTSAAEQASYLNTSTISPVAVTNLSSISLSSASAAVLSMAKVIVESDYQVRIKTQSLSGTTWTGSFTVTNYANEEDTADSNVISVTINDNYEMFIRQKLNKSLNKGSNSNADISILFNMELPEFKEELKKYCLNSLKQFDNVCLDCMNLLIEQGISNDITGEGLYETLYLPYYNKELALQSEVRLRENEIAITEGRVDGRGGVVLDGMQTIIERHIKVIQEALNFEKYLGADLLKELAIYRREDTYENTNYISDGLENSELIYNALEFLKVAEDELIKSSTMQHSITSSFKNLLVMKEFEPLTDSFQVGNWIRLKVDDNIHKLRIVGYTIDFDNLSELEVEFSDAQKIEDGISDIKSVLSMASDMSTSYDYVSRQASKGQSARQVLADWVGRGLSLTQLKIINDATDQNLQIDERGILCREYIPMFDRYDDKQVRLINKGLYFTDNNWHSARAGIGNFTYYDPSDGQEKEAYGVIADTIVSNIVLSEKVGIYNRNGAIKLDEHGLTLISSESRGTDVFRIQRELGDGTVKNVIYFDNAGNAVFDGKISAACITSGEISPERFGVGSITGTKIAGGTITTSNIAANAITTEKINAGAITADTIASDAITSEKIKAGAITADKIAAKAITASMISSGTLSPDLIGPGSITGTKIAEGAITTENIAANAITAAKIAAGTITANEIQAGAITGDMITTGIIRDKEGKNYWNLTTGEFKLQASSDIDTLLTQDEIFKRLTGDSTEQQGITLENKKLRINATYINAGYLTANRIKGGTLSLGGWNDENGDMIIYNNGGRISGKWDRNGIQINSGTINIGENFSVNETGKLECKNAEIIGKIVSSNGNGQWIMLKDGGIFGGDSYTGWNSGEDGRILFGNYVDGAGDGIHFISDNMFFDAGDIYVRAYNHDTKQWVLAKAHSGNVWISDNMTLRFERGLLLQLPG